MQGELYPRIEWSSGISTMVRDGSTFQRTYGERLPGLPGRAVAALMQQRAVHIEAGQVSTSPMPSGPES